MTDLRLTSNAPPPLPPRRLLVCRGVSCWHNSHFMMRHWARPSLTLFLSYSWSLESGFRQTLQIAGTDMHWFHHTASCNLYRIAAFIFNVDLQPTLNAFHGSGCLVGAHTFERMSWEAFWQKRFLLFGNHLTSLLPFCFRDCWMDKVLVQKLSCSCCHFSFLFRPVFGHETLSSSVSWI